MAISTKDISELRSRTSAGMMDCKKALEEAEGDMERAAELLRAKGIAKAEKRAGRSTTQGLVNIEAAPDGSRASIICLTCETDFVARTDNFVALAARLASRAAAVGAEDATALLAAPAEEGATDTVADLVQRMSGTTGEAVNLSMAATFAPVEGTVGQYLHHNRQVGVLVEVSGAGARTPEGQALARELAMHVASADPVAVRPEEIAAELVDRERRIAEEQVAAEGKPEAVRGKIVEGKVRKFLSERALLEQPFVKDDKTSVGQVVAAAAKAAGGDLTVVRFARVRIGES